MELTVVRGMATPEELEAIAAAVARCVTRNARAARGEEDRDTRWAASGRPSRGPLPAGGRDGWRLSGWSAGRDLW
ncbi:acyl-CoA carboxylase subunit epsilon [Nonomuraea sp. GTA35]|uniref:acyl-CoA carboxylase subunit epsilon n=1 Tax=Nonomuraea sp. GTA35 TaxID=1676746 RepID=UPI0035C25B5A